MKSIDYDVLLLTPELTIFQFSHMSKKEGEEKMTDYNSSAMSVLCVVSFLVICLGWKLQHKAKSWDFLGTSAAIRIVGAVSMTFSVAYMDLIPNNMVSTQGFYILFFVGLGALFYYAPEIASNYARLQGAE